jgi:hypothetical protein
MKFTGHFNSVNQYSIFKKEVKLLLNIEMNCSVQINFQIGNEKIEIEIIPTRFKYWMEPKIKFRIKKMNLVS